MTDQPPLHLKLFSVCILDPLFHLELYIFPSDISKKFLTDKRLVLTEWFLGLEERGLRLFEDNISKLHSKLIFDETKFGPDASVFNMDSKKTNADLFFFDNRGEVAEEAAEDEDMETMDTAFLVAARSMKSTPSNGRKKRKEWEDEEGEVQMKFVKYKLDNRSVKEDFTPSVAHDMSSGSEVENPASDEDMEDTD